MSSPDDDDRNLFAGVRFVLVGFDSVSESQYRAEMVRRGGADAGRLGGGCTHVVACGRVYDDPVCVAARAQGHKVVSELWVDDSLDRAVLADADRVIYWPTRDLKGIPGSDELRICLTGYQRNDREDIMKMVALMGAHFSKPLVGGVVTHLVCYKFEGEKYDLAKKVNIKLTNHRWLEDCLKSWEILPVDDYSKSSWELEMLEAQVKDSDDEVEDVDRKPFNSRSSVKRTPNPQSSIRTSGNPGIDAQIRPPIIPNDDKNMAVDRHLNTPSQIKKEGNMIKKTHDITAQLQGTPNFSRLASSANTDSGAPIQTAFVKSGNRVEAEERNLNSPDQVHAAEYEYVNTSDQIRKEENMVKKTHDITAQLQATPNFSRLASSANTDGAAPIQIPFGNSDNREEAAVRNLNSPNHLQAAEYEYVNTSGQTRKEENMVKKTHDITAQLQATPNFSRFASSADTDSGAPIQPPFVISGNREEAAVRNLNNPNQVQVDVGTDIATGAPGATSSSDIATGATGTPSSSTMAVPANHHFHSSNDTLMVPKNTATPRARKTGARRPCSVSMEVDGSVVNNGKAVVSESETDKIIPCQQAGTIPKDGSSIASATEREITSLKKVPAGTPSSSRMSVLANHNFSSSNETLTVPKTKATPRARNAGAKRPHSDSLEVDGSVVNNGKAVVSEPETEKMLPCQLASATSKKGSSSASVTERKTTSSKKVPFGGVRSAHAKRQQSVHIEVNAAQVGSQLELNKVISQENIETGPKRFCSSALDAEHERKSPKKLPNTRVKSTVAKKSRKSDTNMTTESPADEAEKVPAESLFDDLFPSENVEDCPKKLSSTASVDGCDAISPENMSKTRARKVVAKRKIKAVEDKSGSKHNKIGSALVSAAKAFSSKRMESTCNIDEVTADQDSRKDNNDAMRDVSVSSCKDTLTVEKLEGMHKSKLRCSERNKALASDHDKENQQDHGNLSSKSDCGKGGLNSKFALRSARNKATASDHDKENRHDPGNLSSKSDCENRGLNSKFDLESAKKNTDMLDKHGGREGNGAGTFITLDPTCFILSGHRWQRRDYRSILRRLKGRVCRDSHHWSYQATHFIAPDPLRRTEKFFAAAAAGRWILKPDYLTSCNEAGKLLDEGPFEWSGTGLNEGETISFEAPRKWRAIKQQMGHGAFYGMQIIVYGQLIAPSLDTVKRAVRAGDGNILATSPPYTRFLNSGVDFAVISASMPSADAWVQEFISHNIPCVSADYLVEYVCKPGYPLDRHVLFKTNRLANKSLAKLLKNQQEVATDDLEELEDDDPADDLSCSVCGSTDRGEVMLICGSEDGSVGCGAGMHIDCCEPPLECVPDDDWLCPKCDVSKAKKKPSAPSKSRGSKRRR
ncbi:BRCT domain-containing protein At4g02110 [Lolium perenne]|uniref:BRCT domain-containing protein At4g02110 n=1 Tax=Lolium perenne TaxID=4522 RepID=UPI0021F5393F|nr:BRCT domain-containing protein At4g02110-like isoform X1 [Lolium perenne]